MPPIVLSNNKPIVKNGTSITPGKSIPTAVLSPSPQQVVDLTNNLSNTSKKETIAWWKRREELPFEARKADGGVKMGFNYWMEHEESEGHHVIELLELLLNPTKPVPDSFFIDADEIESMRGVWKSVNNQKGHQQIVCMSLCGFRLQEFQSQYDNLEFFKKCSSVPFLSVARSEVTKMVGDNPNSWFYNDVRSVGSTILLPKIPANHDISSLVNSGMTIGELLRDFQVRFEVRD